VNGASRSRNFSSFAKQLEELSKAPKNASAVGYEFASEAVDFVGRRPHLQLRRTPLCLILRSSFDLPRWCFVGCVGRGLCISHRYARDLSKRRRQDFALCNQPMCVGVTIAAAISDPKMVGAYANCLFQVLHENSYVGRRNFAGRRLTNEKQAIDGTG
jgi:hypothetical protein